MRASASCRSWCRIRSRTKPSRRGDGRCYTDTPARAGPRGACAREPRGRRPPARAAAPRRRFLRVAKSKDRLDKGAARNNYANDAVPRLASLECLQPAASPAGDVRSCHATSASSRATAIAIARVPRVAAVMRSDRRSRTIATIRHDRRERTPKVLRIGCCAPRAGRELGRFRTSSSVHRNSSSISAASCSGRSRAGRGD